MKVFPKEKENAIRDNTADPTVPYQQSVDLHKKLQDLGVKSQFMTVEGGLHGKFDKEKNSEINVAILQFIAELDSFK